METKLQRIAEIAKENPKEKFTSLMHIVNKDVLRKCHEELKANKATGVDKVTKEEYGKDLDNNIEELLNRMKQFKYVPKPARRAYIPKEGSKKGRPLGIPSYEDKLVQLAMNKVLTAIYEQDYLDCSFGFRPNRNCHDALKILNLYLDRKNVNYVVDADIKGFFDNVDHKCLMKFLEHRIKDRNFLRYIGRFLKAGIMETGNFQKTYEGTPQGGIISPTLGNIYLHYVVDLWFEEVVRKWCKGEAYIVRYCDDFVCCFQYKEEAEAFYRALKKRLEKFNLELAEDKSKIIYFGKKAYYDKKFGRTEDKPKTFDFLGFTHYCSCRDNGSFRVKRKTSAKKMRGSLKRIKEWLIINRTLPINVLMSKLKLKLQGYYRYYGVSDNTRTLGKFKRMVEGILFKWLNRRSQRRSYSWQNYYKLLERYKLPNPKLYTSIFELKKTISYIL